MDREELGAIGMAFIVGVAFSALLIFGMLSFNYVGVSKKHLIRDGYATYDNGGNFIFREEYERYYEGGLK